MFDELFELFDRDGRETRQGERRGGIRGFLSRLFAGDDDDRDDGRPDDERRRTRRDDDRRDRDEMFDFGD